MTLKRFVVAIILFAGWTSSCKQSNRFTGKLIPGDRKAAISIINDTSSARISAWHDGTSTKIFGKHWYNNTGNKMPVKMILNEDTINAAGIQYNIDGSFLASLPPLHLIKTYTLRVIQHNETGEHKEASVEFNISSKEKD